jgi:hypothetical protein
LNFVEGRLHVLGGIFQDSGSKASSVFSGIGFGIQQAIGSKVVSGVQSLAGSLLGGITGAADLNESLSKVGVTFGPAAGTVTAAADELASKFGIVKQTTLDAASSFGLIAQGAGLSAQESAGLSVSLAKLAADAGSFYNVPTADALEKIRSGLVGESEPLRAFGVLLSETAVQNEAVRLGLSKTTKGLSESAKVTARASLIQAGLSKASGDLARTQDSASNVQRAAAGRFQNAFVEAGGVLLPVYQELIGGVNSLGAGIGTFISENKSVFQGWSSTVVDQIHIVVAGAQDFGASVATFFGSESGALITGGIGAAITWLKDTFLAVVSGIGSAISTVGVMIRNWGDITQIVGITIFQSLSDIGTRFAWLGTAVGAFLNWFGSNWTSIFTDAFSITISVFNAFFQRITGRFQELKAIFSDPTKILEFDFSKFNPVEDIKAAMAAVAATPLTAPPLVIPELQLDHTAADAQIAEITQGIADREAARTVTTPAAAAADATTPAVPGAPGTPTAPGAPAAAAAKAPEARVTSLEEFAKSLQTGALSAKDKAAQTTADATQRTAVATEQLVQQMKTTGNGKAGPGYAVGPA